MASFKGKRCHHCLTSYSYQASGGNFSPTNDDRLCPDCMQVVLTALASVPRKFDKVLVETTEVSAFDLEERREKRREAAQASGSLCIERVAFPLFDLGDPSRRQIVGIETVNGRTYHWEYWSHDPKGTARVRVEMEKNLATGELRPW